VLCYTSRVPLFHAEAMLRSVQFPVALPTISGPGAVSEERQSLICPVYRVSPVIYGIGVVLMNSG
jgi:hypothetical protein